MDRPHRDMVRKALSAAAVCLLAVAALFGCSKEIPISTIRGGTYNVVHVTTAQQYADRTAAAGNKLLLVSIEGTENELDDMQAIFFGSQPGGRAMVTDGTMNSECILVVYAPAKSDTVNAVLVFEVPETFLDTFTLYGESFDGVALNVEK